MLEPAGCRLLPERFLATFNGWRLSVRVCVLLPAGCRLVERCRVGWLVARTIWVLPGGRLLDARLTTMGLLPDSSRATISTWGVLDRPRGFSDGLMGFADGVADGLTRFSTL
jgi:hypothetical protein